MRTLTSLFSRRTAKVALNAISSAEGGPASGLVSVSIEVGAERPADARLRLHTPARAGPAFEAPIAPGEGPARLDLVLHSHLLPNGEVPVRVDVVDGRGQVLAEQTLTLQLRNEGQVARQVEASLRANGAPLVFQGACDSAFYDYGDESLAAWFDRSPEAVEAHLADLAASGAATEDEIYALRHFASEGFLVMPRVIEADLVARVNAEIDDAVERKVEGYEWGSSQRMHNLHLDYSAIHELWLHRAILRMLSLIFDAPARPCQSLTYVFGSQQEHHQDTIHLTPFPAGRMCGVWTALEDVQADSGELVVFPRSHRLPRVYMNSMPGVAKVTDDWGPFGQAVVAQWTDMIVKHGFGRVPYRPRAGTVLIWHENLMHAGSTRIDMSKSRRSIVGHYCAEGCIVYFDSSGMPGAVYQGALP